MLPLYCSAHPVRRCLCCTVHWFRWHLCCSSDAGSETGVGIEHRYAVVEDGFGQLKKGGGYRMAKRGPKTWQTSYSRSLKTL